MRRTPPQSGPPVIPFTCADSHSHGPYACGPCLWPVSGRGPVTPNPPANCRITPPRVPCPPPPPPPLRTAHRLRDGGGAPSVPQAELTCVKRGFFPRGGGEIKLTVAEGHCGRPLRPISMTDPGTLSRVYGQAFAAGVARGAGWRVVLRVAWAPGAWGHGMRSQTSRSDVSPGPRRSPRGGGGELDIR